MKKDMSDNELVESSKLLGLYAEDAAGQNDYADIESTDIAIPFLNILQDLSPQVKKGPGQIPGCEAGNIFETVNSTIWPGDKGVVVVPCAYQKRFVEWITRKNGGGFIASHEDEQVYLRCTRDKDNRLCLPNGHEIVPTSLHFVLIINNGTCSRAVISMTMTKRKKSRQWIGMMTANRLNDMGREYLPRMFQYTYRLSTVLESKDTLTFYNWHIGRAELLRDNAIYEEAKRFNATFTKAKINLADSVDSDDDRYPPFNA